jgi:membrane-bound lytic murein transglycosylase D
MRFFRTSTKKKRLKINALPSIVYVTVAMALGACSSTPKSTTQIESRPDHPNSNTAANSPTESTPRAGSRGGLSSILSAPDDDSDDQADTVAPYSADAKTVWPRIRNGYKLDWRQDNPAIAKEVQWYRNNPTFLYHTTERSSRYLHYVVSATQQRNMPTELALLPIVESAYDPFAYSRSGAAGLWQFIPDTGQTFGLKQNWWYDGRKDVVASTDAALNYLQYLHDKFNGDWLLAIAAYNFGEGSIQRAVEANRKLGLPTDFWHLSLREETRIYIPRLLALAKIVNAPHNYGISLYAVPNEAYFAAVETHGQLDLNKAASLARVDVDEVYRLNPGFNHWATDPQGPQRLLLPVGAVDRFTQQLASLPQDQRIAWTRYEVKKGDTLVGVARRFNLDAATLGTANRLGSTALKPGQSLLIPTPGHTPEQLVNIAAPANVQTPFGSKQLFHTVQAGENLLRLSQRYGVSIKDVQRWNGMAPDAPLKLGQRLSIWTDKSDKAIAKTAAATPATSTASAQTTHKVGYTVRNGDSLQAIANKFNVQINDIVRWNQVNPRALLQPGQHLTLFVDAAVAGR